MRTWKQHDNIAERLECVSAEHQSLAYQQRLAILHTVFQYLFFPLNVITVAGGEYVHRIND